MAQPPRVDSFDPEDKDGAISRSPSEDGGTKVKLDDEEYRIVYTEDILGVVEG